MKRIWPIIETVAMLEVAYYYLHDGAETLHGTAWAAFTAWYNRRREVQFTRDMIASLPEA